MWWDVWFSLSEHIHEGHIYTILQLNLIPARESGKALVICQFLPFIIHELSESAILLSRDAVAQYKHFNNGVAPFFLSLSLSLCLSLSVSLCLHCSAERQCAADLMPTPDHLHKTGRYLSPPWNNETLPEAILSRAPILRNYYRIFAVPSAKERAGKVTQSMVENNLPSLRALAHFEKHLRSTKKSTREPFPEAIELKSLYFQIKKSCKNLKVFVARVLNAPRTKIQLS